MKAEPLSLTFTLVYGLFLLFYQRYGGVGSDASSKPPHIHPEEGDRVTQRLLLNTQSSRRHMTRVEGKCLLADACLRTSGPCTPPRLLTLDTLVCLATLSSCFSQIG